MNAFILKLKKLRGGVGPDSIRILSSLDRTHSLPAKFNERVVVGRDDVTVIRNYSEARAHFSVSGEDSEGGRLVFRPSRQQSFTVYKGRELDFYLDGGESCVVRHEHARDPMTAPERDARVSA